METIKEEFAEYLRNNWDNRENLPVADWFISKWHAKLEEAKKNTMPEKYKPWLDDEEGRLKYTYIKGRLDVIKELER